MWRSLFLSIGIFLMLFGVQCLGVRQFTFKAREEPPPQTSLLDSTPAVGPQKKFVPAPWVPWSMMASGAVVCLYSFTIPKRVAGN
ncbi:MAG: hypothetical protein IT426_14315 [Pirellulales bacterium]|nr:hypothetical protein [Pirellulales bacterium]